VRRSDDPGRSLDAVNFLLADVRGALGPYLNIFLVTDQHWTQSGVGLVTTIGGLLGLAVQTPIGALIDATRAKRALIVGALGVLAAGALAIFLSTSFWPVLAANAAISMVGDVFGPAVAALTLGLYRRARLARRLGRNAAFDHAGNIAVAVLAGLIGWLLSQRAVFLLVPAFAVLAAAATLSIPAGAIDHQRARGGGNGATAAPQAAVLITCRPLLVFAACGFLFHFANAPLLPFVGQKLADAHAAYATAMLSACIVAAQLVMLGVALLVGRNAERWGRRPILLLGFASVPLRALLFTVSDDTGWLLLVQLLDGIGAGVLGAMMPLVIADLTRGTGRFNVAQGAVATIHGAGAALAGIVGGMTVDRFGYAVAFYGAAAVGLIAMLLLGLLGETRSQDTDAGVRQAFEFRRMDGGLAQSE
jgi:predicted MFS family arabinose efflux permease